MIKEFCKDSSTAVIRSTHYGSKLSVLLEMFSEAEIDFPGLKSEDVTVVRYAGKHYARTFGIEFPAKYAPEEYTRIGQLEYT